MTLVLVELDRLTAGHLRLALEAHVAYCRTNAIPIPASVKELAARSSGWASTGQDGSQNDEAADLPHHRLMPTADLLDLPTVAARLGRSTSTIKRMVKAGALPTVTLPGVRGLRVPRAAVDEMTERTA